MIKNTNYITIQGWMKNELKLNGNELLVFAIVYGFLQDGKFYTGSRQYIADWIGISTRWVQEILNRFVGQKILERNTINHTQTTYMLGEKTLKIIGGGCEDSSQGVGTQFTGGMKIVHRGCEDSSHNNTIYITKDNTNNTYYNLPFEDKEFNEYIKLKGYDKVIVSEYLLSQIKMAGYKKKNGEKLTKDTWKGYVDYWVKKTIKENATISKATDDGSFDKKAMAQMRARRLGKNK